jgi:hypothetical protein
VGPDETILGEILGVFVIADQMEGGGIDGRVKPADKLVKGGRLTTKGPIEQCRFIQHERLSPSAKLESGSQKPHEQWF